MRSIPYNSKKAVLEAAAAPESKKLQTAADDINSAKPIFAKGPKKRLQIVVCKNPHFLFVKAITHVCA